MKSPIKRRALFEKICLGNVHGKNYQLLRKLCHTTRIIMSNPKY